MFLRSSSSASESNILSHFLQRIFIDFFVHFLLLTFGFLPCRTPAHKIRSTYTNRHDLVSTTLQGICDAHRKFIDVFCGPPSKIHDSRIFQLSSISRTLPETCANVHHILGDAAYLLREYLITPYRNPQDEGSKKFNQAFSATRVRIENCFGLLKQRFRQLMMLEFWDVSSMSKFIMACCVLHNICLLQNDDFDIEIENDYHDNEIQPPDIHPTRKSTGQIKRNSLKQIVLENYNREN